MKIKYSLGSLVVAALLLSIPLQAVAPFRNGERAVFLGNSITDGGHYHSFIWLYYMTRFPGMDIRVMNAGIGGDTAHDMYERLEQDVFSKKPTSLVVTFGMNDSGYYEYNWDNSEAFGEKKYQECLANFRKMEAFFLTYPTVRYTMMGGSPYDEQAVIEGNTPFKGKNAVMKRIVNFQQEAAQANNWDFLDLNEAMMNINTQFQQKDPGFTLCGNDRIHPDNDGHMVMAYLFLKAQGFSGKKVAEMEVSAASGKVVKSENCKISNVKNTADVISFDYLAKALPYPLDTTARGWGSRKSQAEALSYIPFMDEMNSEVLKVTGLSGMYKLLIDDEEIGTWSGKELAGGINLAAQIRTPQYQQALAIMHLNELRWEIERNFRDYAWIQFGFFQQNDLLFANNSKAVEVMDKELNNNIWLKNQRSNYARFIHQAVRDAREAEMDVLVKQIYKLNKPLKRKIILQKL